MNSAPLPLVAQLPEPEPVELDEQSRHSERLSNKTIAKLPTLEKAKVVLMKKLGILDDTANAKRAQEASSRIVRGAGAIAGS
jgi:hypothetical protein